MSVKVMGMVFDRYPAGGGEMVLALSLADHADHDGENIYPSVKRLALRTRQSERAVQYQLRKMEQADWLQVVGNEGGGRNNPRVYRINPDWIKGADISQAETVKGANYDTKGCNPEQQRVQNEALKGATAIAPEPSLTVNNIDPSLTVNIGRSAEQNTHSTKKQKTETSSRFEEFYSEYPKKRARVKAESIWKRKKLDMRADELIADVRRRKREDRRWLDGFIPDPTTYLNQERWEDEIERPKPTGANSNGRKFSIFDDVKDLVRNPDRRDAGGPVYPIADGVDLLPQMACQHPGQGNNGAGRK